MPSSQQPATPIASASASASASPYKPLPSANSFRTLERQKEAINPSPLAPHYPLLNSIAAPHVHSFNSIFRRIPSGDTTAHSSASNASIGIGEGGLLEKAVEDIGRRVVFESGDRDGNLGKRLEVWISAVNVGKPQVESTRHTNLTTLYPSECRERGVSYRGKIQAKLCWTVDGGPVQSDTRNLGYLPIMVRSARCNIEGKSPQDLVRLHEDPDEFGGYFIVNGIERLIRLLIVPRRNHPVAIVRSSFQKRGPTYTPYGVSIRCARKDNTSQSLTLHYLSDGTVNLRFSYRKSEYMVPILLILRALQDASDKEIFERITMGKTGNTFLTDRVELLLKGFARYSVHTKRECLGYIGEKFAVMLDSPEDWTTEQVGVEFLKRIVLVHLEGGADKFNLLVFMIQKLYSLVAGECATDNPDSPQHQEVLLGGHLYLSYMKEKLADWLQSIIVQIRTDIRRTPAQVDFQDRKYLSKVFSKVNSDVGRKMEYFLATGNLQTNTGLDLQQVSGYTIVAEKLNFYRYISHFASIHRGAFFAELKTTTVRKLLPEAWGFLCPVHTPDGAPCGLLNHLSHTCRVIVDPLDTSGVEALVASLGVGTMGGTGPKDFGALRASGAATENGKGKSKVDKMDVDSEEESEEDEAEVDPVVAKKLADSTLVTIHLDGKPIGWCTAALAARVAKTLRHAKVQGLHKIPLDLEIGWVPPSKGGQYPGLFMFSTPARMMRPVEYLPTGKTDMVGSFEQVYMDIACLNEDIIPGTTTHREIHPTAMLSIVANLTPFSDFNQSPRNMYQCQMGKQSMGTPAQNFPHRTDNKMYRLQTGQTPIVRPQLHNQYGMDGYPNGMNAVVAVIAYTGYDMEDASIISKSAHERGYGYGTVYKSEFIDLADKQKGSSGIHLHFGLFGKGEGGRVSSKVLKRVEAFLDADGLPRVGIKLTDGDPYYAYVDDVDGKVHVVNFKSMEDAYVDEVRLVGSDSGLEELQKVHIKLRIPRPPIIGDKFSSRHGQKGVISQKWPAVDMPFSESGIIPDVIINPHAFPSRMTIGMFVESLAGKSGALHGRAQDATPFQFNEDHAAADFFGEELKQAGFNFHGNEPMYSGISGREFKADIYIGVVYYQRLRHMVSDKYQVRTTGPVHNLTQQPIKGRKRAGGIRLGEMERDSLLAHGVSFILQDRLMNCSDYTQTHVCKLCGSILSPVSVAKRRVVAVGESQQGHNQHHNHNHANGHNSNNNGEGPSNASGSTSSELTLMGSRNTIECLTCKTSAGIDVLAVPYVFKYLCTELVAMNVRLKLDVV
ncbi:hypothetical protein HDV05_003831 [Chytridiales sp. JEL 0842]|nr:hypothetical protein HDV05_003831 [Chytridiales sp. JEL 0842]